MNKKSKIYKKKARYITQNVKQGVNAKRLGMVRRKLGMDHGVQNFFLSYVFMLPWCNHNQMIFYTFRYSSMSALICFAFRAPSTSDRIRGAWLISARRSIYIRTEKVFNVKNRL